TLLVRHLGHHAAFHEHFETLGEKSPRDAETSLEGVETCDTSEGVADDQQRPALTDDLKSAGEPAGLVGVLPAKHASSRGVWCDAPLGRVTRPPAVHHRPPPDPPGPGPALTAGASSRGRSRVFRPGSRPPKVHVEV